MAGSRSLLRRASALNGRKYTRLARQRFTLASQCEIKGVGLHTGLASRVCLQPAEAALGLHFVRTDLPGAPIIPARASNVSSTLLSTTIMGSDPDASISTVEHLLAAICGANITSCRIEVSAPELPLLDGSASEWTNAIISAGLVEHGGHTGAIELSSIIRVQEKDSWVVARPALATRVTVGIDFPTHSPIGRQWATWAPGKSSNGLPWTNTYSFARTIAPARTFTIDTQVAALREAGLIQGGTLDNALVCDASSWLNGPLRFKNEPARHKLLDLVGDLALLGGRLPMAHIIAYKASHKLHVQLAQKIEAQAAVERN
jgi:UDP-3-O-[3-hydroxymyristoyl] N-acetylglucosamine deacetylase